MPTEELHFISPKTSKEQQKSEDIRRTTKVRCPQKNYSFKVRRHQKNNKSPKKSEEREKWEDTRTTKVLRHQKNKESPKISEEHQKYQDLRRTTKVHFKVTVFKSDTTKSRSDLAFEFVLFKII